MKNFKLRFLAMCGLVVLLAASLAPILAEASCPSIMVDCGGGRIKSCSGTQDGDKCVYSESCLNCSTSGGGGGGDIQPILP